MQDKAPLEMLATAAALLDRQRLQRSINRLQHGRGAAGCFAEQERAGCVRAADRLRQAGLPCPSKPPVLASALGGVGSTRLKPVPQWPASFLPPWRAAATTG